MYTQSVNGLEPLAHGGLLPLLPHIDNSSLMEISLASTLIAVLPSVF